MKLADFTFTDSKYFWVKDIWGHWIIVDVYLSATGYRVRDYPGSDYSAFLVSESYWADKEFYGPIQPPEIG